VNGIGYIIAAWTLVSGAIALYALRLIQRGRTLSRRVPDERRRWMSTEGDA
jgi:hypothetical protein